MKMSELKASAVDFVNAKVRNNPANGHKQAQNVVNAIRNVNTKDNFDAVSELWCVFAEQRIQEISGVIDLANRDREGAKPEFLGK